MPCEAFDACVFLLDRQQQVSLPSNAALTLLHHHHLSINREGRWGTTDDFTTGFLHYSLGRWGTTDDFTTGFLHYSLFLQNPPSLFFSERWQSTLFQIFPLLPVFHCPLGLGELQACPFPDVVFPPLPLSALSPSLFHCALQYGFGRTG